MSLHTRTFECPKCGHEQEISFSYRYGSPGSYYEPPDPSEVEQEDKVEEVCPGCGKHFCSKRIERWEEEATESVYDSAPADDADYAVDLYDSRDYDSTNWLSR